MEIRRYEVNSFVFADERPCVILSGSVEVRQICCGTRMSQLVGKYQPGDIIGLKIADDGVTSSLLTWCQCISQVEVAHMDRACLRALW